MAPKKKPTTGEGTTPRANPFSPLGASFPQAFSTSAHRGRYYLRTFTGASEDIHPPLTYEDQLLQMFTDMREEMVKQQVLFA